MEHELRLATYQQRAGGQDDGSLNKLPQMNVIVWRVIFLVEKAQKRAPAAT